MNNTIIRKVPCISRKTAVSIAASHNCVPVEVAIRYTTSELKETLKHAGFRNIAIKE